MAGDLSPQAALAQVLDPLVSARRLLSLIEGAESAGVLDALSEGATVERVATKTSLDKNTVVAALEAFVAGDVVERDGDLFTLTPAWRAARSSGAVRPLSATLSGDRIGAELIRMIGSGVDYWTMTSDDRVALAASMSPDPIRGSLLPQMQRGLEDGDPVHTRIAGASRYLELGCGLAGFSLSLLQVHSNLSVVAVERSPDLADEAERRAALVGVDDRFTVIRGEASEFADSELFDVAFWSQFFFAEPDRAPALEVCRRHVRSGGMVFSPIMYADPAAGAPPAAVLRYRLFRVMLQSWGVPERRPDELVEEFEEAGFQDVTVVSPKFGRPPQLIATRP